VEFDSWLLQLTGEQYLWRHKYYFTLKEGSSQLIILESFLWLCTLPAVKVFIGLLTTVSTHSSQEKYKPEFEEAGLPLLISKIVEGEACLSIISWVFGELDKGCL
jgi:hypothetical protein